MRHLTARPPAATTGLRRPPRMPGASYAVLSLVLLILVAAFALTSTQAAPPTIAEFAPQAVEQITDVSGDGEAGGAAARAARAPEQQDATADAARTAIDVARVRQCVGDPPRQIEDPQSPPCVPHWSGDNGGATWRGVTRDEIRIADPTYGPRHVLWERFFNSRFEFYGRHLRLIRVPCCSLNQEGQQAEAVYADEEVNAFGSLYNGAYGGVWYVLELARRGVVATTIEPLYGEDVMSRLAPYLWQYPTATDREFGTIGTWACSRLAGRTAAHAGDPVLAGSRRVFGLALTRLNEGQETTSAPMERELGRCGERFAVSEDIPHYSYDDTSPEHQTADRYVSTMIRMKAAGVTTVVCMCNGQGGNGEMAAAASSQGYFPEWVVATYYYGDSNFSMRTLWPKPQSAHAFGLSFLPKQIPVADDPGYWAATEADSTATGTSVEYRTLLLLASGVQMAGPNLTAATFERALHRTVFPNPEHPTRPGRVGFRDGDHSMIDDVAEIWWSNTALAPDGQAGGHCYVDGGARRPLHVFGTDDPFFKGACDTGAAG